MWQARQRAELNATDAEDKLQAYVWAADPRNGEGGPGEGEQAKAMADLDTSLMQRLDEDSATNHRLLDSLKAAQVWPAYELTFTTAAHTCCSYLLPCAISHLEISFRADSMPDMHGVSVSSKSALTHLHTTGMLPTENLQYAA